MRLFGKVDGSITREDRAGWLTPIFDLQAAHPTVGVNQVQMSVCLMPAVKMRVCVLPAVGLGVSVNPAVKMRVSVGSS